MESDELRARVRAAMLGTSDSPVNKRNDAYWRGTRQIKLTDREARNLALALDDATASQTRAEAHINLHPGQRSDLRSVLAKVNAITTKEEE